MENQHRAIKGYRELSQDEIDLMNEIKTSGAVLDIVCEKVDLHIQKQFAGAREAGIDEIQRLAAANPKRWLLEAQHEMQTALMNLTRAVAQPTTF